MLYFIISQSHIPLSGSHEPMIMYYIDGDCVFKSRLRLLNINNKYILN